MGFTNSHLAFINHQRSADSCRLPYSASQELGIIIPVGESYSRKVVGRANLSDVSAKRKTLRLRVGWLLFAMSVDVGVESGPFT
jgi:hypothetical protein